MSKIQLWGEKLGDQIQFRYIGPFTPLNQIFEVEVQQDGNDYLINTSILIEKWEELNKGKIS